MEWPKETRFIVLSAVTIEVMAYAGIEVVSSHALETVYRDQVRMHEELTARAEADLHNAGLTTVGRVEQGDPREVLVNTAYTEGADLMVVGSHGRTGLPKMLMGSVASHVVTHAPCTVLVVKQPKQRPV
jgi:nucleotide-binding universal stress UspA family protein